MHRIDWEDSKKKGEAYAYLAKVFELKAAQMRDVAVRELGGKLLSDVGVEVKPTKVLDAQGNVTGVITTK